MLSMPLPSPLGPFPFSLSFTLSRLGLEEKVFAWPVVLPTPNASLTFYSVPCADYPEQFSLGSSTPRRMLSHPIQDTERTICVGARVCVNVGVCILYAHVHLYYLQCQSFRFGLVWFRGCTTKGGREREKQVDRACIFGCVSISLSRLWIALPLPLRGTGWMRCLVSVT